jgi:nitrite reductase/ring-hydroxylating ferredoxin subunit
MEEPAKVNDDVQMMLGGWSSDHALPGVLYRDAELYEGEIRRIFLRSWLYVGHQSQIPARGDYFLFEIGGESVIVIRDGEGGVNALLNVCRHRGSRICDAPVGRESRLVCRYHGWTYGLDGSLRAAGHAPEGFNRSALGLRRLQSRVLQGLIFVSFADDPPPFEAIENDLGEPMRPYGLDRARVAHRQNYPIVANWKLAVENYCECYHCGPAHPEYSVGHGRTVPQEQFEALLEAVMERAPAVGLTRHVVRRSWLAAGEVGIDRGFDRYPLLRGHLTGSRDGKPVAPLLGSITGYDGGTTARLLRPRCPVPLHAARAAQHGLRDHLAGQRDGPRGCGLRPGPPDLALGRHDDRRQDDHRAQPGRRRFTVLRAGTALADGGLHPALSGMVRGHHARGGRPGRPSATRMTTAGRREFCPRGARRLVSFEQ